ncbi:MAG: hypothetical protein ACXW39_09240 [Nitrospira sp.]
MAQECARLINETDYLELAIEPELSVVVFRRLGWGEEQYKAWCARLLSDGKALILPTTWHGETLMRFCFGNPRTTVTEIRSFIDSMAIHLV